MKKQKTIQKDVNSEVQPIAMSQLDVFYRALIDYKKNTDEHKDCLSERQSIMLANPLSDSIDAVRIKCTVEQDWLEAIEQGLVHIEKAIAENRQFIMSRGEVTPIEKVKRVSKDSVEHLAKHSDFITKKTEETIPDKLYVVERLSDFALYENRFLYMLLSYLKSFISHRYNMILEVTTTYHGGVTMNKTIATANRKTSIQLKLTDEKRNDWYLKENNPIQDTINRIDGVLKSVMFFLSTPLMQDVAKSPMLKPPVIKTNVLKMNQNFKGAVALYDYITSYEKQGYIIERVEQKITPFPDDAADEFAEVVSLASFLAYKYGLNIGDYLKNSFDIEQQRRKQVEIAKQLELLEQLKKRIAETGCDPTEYMLLLEKRNKALELDCAQIVPLKAEIDKLKATIKDLEDNVYSLNDVIMDRQAEIQRLNQKYVDDLAKQKSMYTQEIADINSRHQEQTEQLINQHESETLELTTAHAEEVEKLNLEHSTESEQKNRQIEELEGKLVEEMALYKKQIEAVEYDYTTKLDKQKSDFDAEVKHLTAANVKQALEYDQLLQAKTLSDSQFNALRAEHKLFSEDDDFTTQSTFTDLEKQLKAFKLFFKEEWKKTKRKIRKDVLKPESDSDNMADDGFKS